ncbi:hypothetical protein GO755_30445 [Spirosoma sp. HMF4905]|uniref:Uncharacterized protein n=1 Tax=Spirosoma arboris TaxID=2682092 RepID=A0A7K1SKQ0_9BACT|nr:hypothetical protein [Spirosoma arboris]MVM34391.1 hypothetical protein [Spirosoma arboris]
MKQKISPIPSFEVVPDLLEWVRQIIDLKGNGFFTAYQYNLILYQKKGEAYEAIEKVFEQFYGKRRFSDREVFFVKLSQWKKRQNKF